MFTFSVLSILILPILAATVFTGAWFARRSVRLHGTRWNRSGLESSLIGAYGLLLSFGFFLSGNVHREYAALVHDQSEVLAKLYRESQLLPAEEGAVVRDRIRAILALEVQVAGVTDEVRAEIETRCGRAYDELWSTLSSRATASGATATYRPAIDCAQRAIALEYRLRFNEAERSPPAFLILLLGGSLLVAFLIGFTCASEGHGRLVPVGYVLLAGCTLVTILDLNDPWHGFLRPSQENYAQLLHAIERP